MCGIFGVVARDTVDITEPQLTGLVDELFRLSDSRGKEASGWAVRTERGLTVFKQPTSGTHLSRMPESRRLFHEAVHANGSSRNSPETATSNTVQLPLALIGHSRLVTNGRQTLNSNNQPVIRDGFVGVHNGIVVNVDQLWQRCPDTQPDTEVDTEIILHLLHGHMTRQPDVETALARTFEDIEGTASIALLSDVSDRIILASNNGSLYLAQAERTQPVFFASERYILECLLRHRLVRTRNANYAIEQIGTDQACIVDFLGDRVNVVSLKQNAANPRHEASQNGKPRLNVQVFPRHEPFDPLSLKRCSRCVLPETFPGITFDDDGVCNLCHSYQPMQASGHDALEKAVAPYRRTDGGPDCVVAFSGGRDSSYGLHYLKAVLGLNPIAFTYDWGMVTDLARRNQARLCGKLGIEHIMISADIRHKRLNVRRNIEAWLRRPELGMIPLFMAGDKQFFYYANKLKKQTGSPLMVFAVNPLEKTGFKTGFCGVHDNASGMYFSFSLAKKLRISGYYLKQYLLNPAYFNASLPDTFWAYASSFMLSHDYLMLFDYIRWDEQTIENTLLDDYDWETATDTRSTWRIGDGTAAFYNHIYYTVAGFTENDTFRSNQIREGTLSREQALELIVEENQPRWESMRWYAKTIGFDLEEALAVIDRMPRRYSNKQ